MHSILLNWRHVLNDARDALAFDPGNIKAHFRAARAALKLREFSLCKTLVAEARQVEQAAELDKILQECLSLEEQDESRRRKEEEERQGGWGGPAREMLAFNIPATVQGAAAGPGPGSCSGAQQPGLSNRTAAVLRRVGQQEALG